MTCSVTTSGSYKSATFSVCSGKYTIDNHTFTQDDPYGTCTKPTKNVDVWVWSNSYPMQTFTAQDTDCSLLTTYYTCAVSDITTQPLLYSWITQYETYSVFDSDLVADTFPLIATNNEDLRAYYDVYWDSKLTYTYLTITPAGGCTIQIDGTISG